MEGVCSVAAGWVKNEFMEIELGDSRLRDRALKLFEQLSEKPEKSIGQACEDWASTKGAYRFFGNEKVSPEKILSAHVKRTVQRSAAHETVLALQDTTSLNFGDRDYIEGLGRVGSNSKKARGYYLHTTLAVSPQGEALGILGQLDWSRAGEKSKDLPFPGSERQRWIEALKLSRELLPKSTRVVNVGDREADMHELVKTAELVDAHYVIRAVSRRRGQVGEETGRLIDLLLKSQSAIEYEIEVKAQAASSKDKKAARTARKARLQVYYAPVTLSPQDIHYGLGPTKSWAILAREKNPPQKEGIDWLLLTNVPVSCPEDALERIGWYKLRWQIELFHKILKTSCRVESLRLETMKRLENYVAMMSVVSWRILWLTYQNKLAPADSCETALTEAEWKSLYLKIHRTRQLPEKPPSLRQAIRWIAQLGGFLGRKGDGEPGIITIARGWQELTTIADDWLLFSGTAISG